MCYVLFTSCYQFLLIQHFSCSATYTYARFTLHTECSQSKNRGWNKLFLYQKAFVLFQIQNLNRILSERKEKKNVKMRSWYVFYHHVWVLRATNSINHPKNTTCFQILDLFFHLTRNYKMYWRQDEKIRNRYNAQIHEILSLLHRKRVFFPKADVTAHS